MRVSFRSDLGFGQVSYLSRGCTRSHCRRARSIWYTAAWNTLGGQGRRNRGNTLSHIHDTPIRANPHRGVKQRSCCKWISYIMHTWSHLCSSYRTFPGTSRIWPLQRNRRIVTFCRGHIGRQSCNPYKKHFCTPRTAPWNTVGHVSYNLGNTLLHIHSIPTQVGNHRSAAQDICRSAHRTPGHDPLHTPRMRCSSRRISCHPRNQNRIPCRTFHNKSWMRDDNRHRSVARTCRRIAPVGSHCNTTYRTGRNAQNPQ